MFDGINYSSWTRFQIDVGKILGRDQTQHFTWATLIEIYVTGKHSNEANGMKHFSTKHDLMYVRSWIAWANIYS